MTNLPSTRYFDCLADVDLLTIALLIPYTCLVLQLLIYNSYLYQCSKSIWPLNLDYPIFSLVDHSSINTSTHRDSCRVIHSSTCEQLSTTHYCSSITMVYLHCSDENQHRAWRDATYHCKMSISHNEHRLGGLSIICCRIPSPQTSPGLHKMLLVDQNLELNNFLSRNYLCPSRCFSPSSNLDTNTHFPLVDHKFPITSTLGPLSCFPLIVHE